VAEGRDHDGDPLVRSDWPWRWWGPGTARPATARLGDALQHRLPDQDRPANSA
jgi:hypothetical protein